MRYKTGDIVKLREFPGLGELRVLYAVGLPRCGCGAGNVNWILHAITCPISRKHLPDSDGQILILVAVRTGKAITDLDGNYIHYRETEVTLVRAAALPPAA